MDIEIFGFPVKPEIGVGDILGASIATIGLITSAIIFYVGYRRNRRNEQLKLWAESWRKIDNLYYKLKEYYISNFDEKTLSSSHEKEQKKLLRPYFDLNSALNEELDFLATLASEKDISRDLIKSSIKGLDEVIKDMININCQIRKDPIRDQVWKEYTKTIGEAPQGIKPYGRLQDLNDKWENLKEKLKQSRLRAFYNKLKRSY